MGNVLARTFHDNSRMAELPNLQPEKPNLNPGENSRACGIPNLQPELPERAPKNFYTLDPDEYPASALPVIARRGAMPGNWLSAITALLIILALCLLAIYDGGFIRTAVFLIVMCLIFVIPKAAKFRYKAMAAEWVTWTTRLKDMVCLDCGEPLTDQPEQGTCPTCTQPYSLESCRWGWKRWRDEGHLASEPPPRPGPMLASQPCPSILAGGPRPYRIFLILESLTALILIVAFSVYSSLLDVFRAEYVVAVFFPAIAAIWILGRRPIRLMSKRAAEVDDLLCPQCAYRLDDRDTRGTCPECGFYYTFANCQWAWRHLRKDKNNPPTPPPFLVPGESTDK